LYIYTLFRTGHYQNTTGVICSGRMIRHYWSDG